MIKMVMRCRALVLGGCGQLGQKLATALYSEHGRQNVMVTDLRTNDFKDAVSVDATDAAAVETAIQQFKPTVIYHLAAMLSGTCELHPTTGLQVNIAATHNVLEAARRHNLAVFGASTIATFGPDSAKSPKINEVLGPIGIYGITKVHMELLGAYYRRTYGVDFRAIKIPIVVSDSRAGGGSAAFTVNMIYDLLTTGKTVVPLKPSTRFPWMHEEDVVKAILDLMRVPMERLRYTTYLVDSGSSTAKEWADGVLRHIPSGQVTYTPDFRNDIVETWPDITVGKEAREDWDHKKPLGQEQAIDTIVRQVRINIGK
jgi:threonine 3-dehydrogenase